MYFSQKREFGSALSKLRNFGGGGFEHPPSQYATDSLYHANLVALMQYNVKEKQNSLKWAYQNVAVCMDNG
jgi:hypothetical protein